MTTSHGTQGLRRALPRQLDGIFLDLYGTLTAGDRAAVHEASRRVVEDLRLGISTETFAVRWGELFFALVDESNHETFRTLEECERLSLAATAGEFGRVIDPVPYVAILVDYQHRPPIHPEISAVLAAMTLPICLVSNADIGAAQSALALHGLKFAHVVTSEEARHYKPHGGIFEFALKRTGWRADRVLHVGDSLHSDIQGAMAAGLHAAWICRDERIHDIGSVTPDHTFTDLRGLQELLSKHAFAA